MNKNGFLLIETILAFTIVLITIPTLTNFIIIFQKHIKKINNTTYNALEQTYLTDFIKTELQKSESIDTPENKSCVLTYHYNLAAYTILYELINKKIRRKQIKIDSNGKIATTYTYLNNTPEIETIHFYIYNKQHIRFSLKTRTSSTSYHIYLSTLL